MTLQLIEYDGRLALVDVVISKADHLLGTGSSRYLSLSVAFCLSELASTTNTFFSLLETGRTPSFHIPRYGNSHAAC